jgi:uncharacterized membrane protein YoaK (UPF0700 family)
MIITLFLMITNATIGFFAYMMRDKLTGHMGEEWQDISDFSLGVTYGSIPFLIMFQSLTGNGDNSLLQAGISDSRLRALVAYIFVWLPFIGGAIIGFRFFPSSRYK